MSLTVRLLDFGYFGTMPVRLSRFSTAYDGQCPFDLEDRLMAEAEHSPDLTLDLQHPVIGPATVEHEAFFEVLGRMTETDANWHVHSAGLMVMRLLDAWIAEGPEAGRVSAWGVRSIRQAIDEIPGTQPIRLILTRIVDAVESAPAADIRAVAPRLMSYGRALDHDGQWLLASDVYRTLLAHLPAELDRELVIDAQMRLGYCLRASGRYEDATLVYRAVRTAAESCGDFTKVLHSQVEEGVLATVRGNLPVAESLLDEVIAATVDHRCDDVRSAALHARAVVAHARGQHEPAVRFAYDALNLAHSLLARDRILTDLAVFLRHLDQFEAARDGFLVVAATAQEQYVRWAAMVNLLEVAGYQHNQPLFHRYRRELASAPLPPYLRANLHFYSAVAQREFSQLDDASSSLATARSLAEAHGFNQLAFEIEALEKALRTQAPSRSPRRSTPAASVGDIVAAVAEMRELVCM